MRRLLYLVPLLVFVLVAVWFAIGLGRDPNRLDSMLIDKPAPAFTLPGLKAGEADFAQADLVALAAKGPVLVNFFASWCGPCRIEHPSLLTLKAEGVPIIGIAYKDKPEAANAWLKELGDPFLRTAADLPGRVAIDWGVYGVPETYVIDRQGRVRYRHVGPIQPEDLGKIIRPLLKELAK